MYGPNDLVGKVITEVDLSRYDEKMVIGFRDGSYLTIEPKYGWTPESDHHVYLDLALKNNHSVRVP